MKKTLRAFFLSFFIFVSMAGFAKDDRSSILKIYNWADYIDEDLIPEFEQWYEEQTGEKVTVVYQLFDINEVMLAKIEKGHADFDLACPSDYIIERMLRNDLLLPIQKEFGKTPNYIENVAPFIRNLFDKADGGDKNVNDYAVGFMWGTTGFLYNKDEVDPEDLRTWAALWNPKFEQKLFVKDAFRDVYSPLLIYANQERIKNGEVTMDELMYDASDESIAVVEELLQKIKPNVLGWEADFGKEMMTQGKALLNMTWSGDAAWAISEAADVNVSLGYVIPDEGSNIWLDGWVIPKYAKNIKAACYFINFMCKSENAIRNMDVIGYVSAVASPEVLAAMVDRAVGKGMTEPVDASYFFGPEADSVILDPVFYADRSVIERCAMMHDSGDRTKAMLEMWSRVKGNNLNGTILIILIAAAVAVVAAIGIRKRSKKNRHGGKRRR